jgi:tetratricopeptide (TPR) repeat protein
MLLDVDKPGWPMGDRQGQNGRDFFISYTERDRPWAEWIAWQLEAAGYTTVLQAWDMPAGTAFVHEMDRAVQSTQRTLLVLSPAYLESTFGEAEWRIGFRTDPSGTRRHLIPVRIQECEPRGLLADRVWIDLVGLDEAEARDRLIEQIQAALRGRAKPQDRPRFPLHHGTAVAQAERPRFPAALPPVWNVPFRRNRAFTGRQSILQQLANQLDGGTGAVTQAINGGGGIGKTATALEYAYRHRTAFDTVWWVRAEEPTTLISDYADLAAALELQEASLADQQQVALAVHRWLQVHDRWLLVLDNAEGPATTTGLAPPLARLVDLLPAEPSGQVLVTSRDASWRREASIAEVDLFTPEEAVSFLLSRAGSSDDQAAGRIAELLGLLPLALEQAGAYVEETGITLSDYLQRLRRFPSLMLAQGEPRDRDPADTVATTWQVSLERVRPVPGALVVLEIAAFLAPEDVPRDLLTQPLDPPAVELADLADPITLDRAVGALRRHGLVKTADGALTVHRLLQQVVRDSLDAEAKDRRLGLAVRLLAAQFPEEPLEPSVWPACARLLPHAYALAAHASQQQLVMPALAELLHRMGTYIGERGLGLTRALELGTDALEMRQQLHQGDHPDIARSLHNVAVSMWLLGDHSGARKLLEQVLRMRQRLYRGDHLDIVRSLDSFAEVLLTLGDPVQARGLYEQALAMAQRLYEGDHPDIARAFAGLAEVLRALGEPAHARHLDEQALAMSQRLYQGDHPDIAINLNDLAEDLYALGEYALARGLDEQALAMRRRLYEGDHPEIARSLNNLAKDLRGLGEYALARELHEQALAMRRRLHAGDHPETAKILDDLGTTVRGLREQVRARQLHQEGLAMFQRLYQDNHPLILTTLIHLAEDLRALGDEAQARNFDEQALAMRQQLSARKPPPSQ